MVVDPPSTGSVAAIRVQMERALAAEVLYCICNHSTSTVDDDKPGPDDYGSARCCVARGRMMTGMATSMRILRSKYGMGGRGNGASCANARNSCDIRIQRKQ